MDWVPLEPVPVQVNPLMLAANAPHANAGKPIVDFLLSKEGQQNARRLQTHPCAGGCGS